MEKKISFAKGLIKDIKDADDGRHGFSATYVQVVYDKGTGKVWGDYHYSIGRNEWNAYRDPSVVTVGNYAGKVTREYLTRAIENRLAGIPADCDGERL